MILQDFCVVDLHLIFDFAFILDGFFKYFCHFHDGFVLDFVSVSIEVLKVGIKFQPLRIKLSQSF